MTIDHLIAFLRTSREEADVLTKQIAGKLGVHESTLGAWENGEADPPLRKMDQWARLFGCELELRAKDEPATPSTATPRSLFGSRLVERASRSAADLVLGRRAR